MFGPTLIDFSVNPMESGIPRNESDAGDAKVEGLKSVDS